MFNYEEIIPENENTRIICQQLYNDFNVKFSEKEISMDIALSMYNRIVHGVMYNNGEVCFVPIYIIDFDRWYEDKYI